MTKFQDEELRRAALEAMNGDCRDEQEAVNSTALRVLRWGGYELPGAGGSRTQDDPGRTGVASGS